MDMICLQKITRKFEEGIQLTKTVLREQNSLNTNFFFISTHQQLLYRIYCCIFLPIRSLIRVNWYQISRVISESQSNDDLK